VPFAILWNPVWPIELPALAWGGAHYVGGLVFLVVGALLRVREPS
jgi:hypothetical protein